jgi:hypothetical protein
MLIASNIALGFTLALLATFVVIIGLLVNVLIVYIVAQVIAEHNQTKEHDASADLGFD